MWPRTGVSRGENVLFMKKLSRFLIDIGNNRSKAFILFQRYGKKIARFGRTVFFFVWLIFRIYPSLYCAVTYKVQYF